MGKLIGTAGHEGNFIDLLWFTRTVPPENGGSSGKNKIETGLRNDDVWWRSTPGQCTLCFFKKYFSYFCLNLFLFFYVRYYALRESFSWLHLLRSFARLLAHFSRASDRGSFSTSRGLLVFFVFRWLVPHLLYFIFLITFHYIYTLSFRCIYILFYLAFFSYFLLFFGNGSNRWLTSGREHFYWHRCMEPQKQLTSSSILYTSIRVEKETIYR